MNRTRPWIAAIATTLLATSMFAPLVARADDDKASTLTLYVGTYTDTTSKGIYQLKFDTTTGAMTDPTLAGETKYPSWVVVSPNNQWLYSVDQNGATVSSFSIDASSGKLTLMNTETSGGDTPCYVACDPKGAHLMVANYSGGSVEVLPIDADGKLGTPTQKVVHKAAASLADKGADKGTDNGTEKKKSPHANAHWIDMDPAGKFVLACDLGLDQVLVYNYDAVHGTLSPNDPPAATLQAHTGPRHLVFSKDAKFAYLIGELDGSITVFSWEPALGTLTQIQRLDGLPKGWSGRNNSAEIALRPDGKFLYASNRGPDDLVIYAVDAKTGKLTLDKHLSCGGKEPRNFMIDPTGKFLLCANQVTNEIVEFKIDEATGDLKETANKVTVPSPVCLIPYPISK